MADGEAGFDGQLVEGDSEWAGWRLFRGTDPFEDLTGPFYARDAGDGTRRSAFRAERKHLNGHGNLHGGCLMTFADFSLFSIAHETLKGVPCVTVSLNGEFVGPAREGDLIESTGQVTRAGGSLVFARGTVTRAGEPLLSFSGVIKKLKPR